MHPGQHTQLVQPMTVLRRAAQRRLAVVLVGVALLLATVLVLPQSNGPASPHNRGAISQLHRLVVAISTSSVSGSDSHQAADGAILAALVLLAAALAMLVAARRRSEPVAGRAVLALRSRGPPPGR
jgi:hypothetical protein